MTTNKTTKSKAGAKTAAKRTTRKSVKQENKHIGLVKMTLGLNPTRMPFVEDMSMPYGKSPS